MAAQTFAVLQALDRTPTPSATAASVVSGFKRWTTVNGPMKTEYNYFQCDDADAFTEDDTFLSGLAHPITAVAMWASGIDEAENGPPTCLLEGVESAATFKTITVYDASGSNGAGLMVIVYGY